MMKHFHCFAQTPDPKASQKPANGTPDSLHKVKKRCSRSEKPHAFEWKGQARKLSLLTKGFFSARLHPVKLKLDVFYNALSP